MNYSDFGGLEKIGQRYKNEVIKICKSYVYLIKWPIWDQKICQFNVSAILMITKWKIASNTETKIECVILRTYASISSSSESSFSLRSYNSVTLVKQLGQIYKSSAFKMKMKTL